MYFRQIISDNELSLLYVLIQNFVTTIFTIEKKYFVI